MRIAIKHDRNYCSIVCANNDQKGKPKPENCRLPIYMQNKIKKLHDQNPCTPSTQIANLLGISRTAVKRYRGEYEFKPSRLLSDDLVHHIRKVINNNTH